MTTTENEQKLKAVNKSLENFTKFFDTLFCYY